MSALVRQSPYVLYGECVIHVGGCCVQVTIDLEREFGGEWSVRGKSSHQVWQLSDPSNVVPRAQGRRDIGTIELRLELHGSEVPVESVYEPGRESVHERASGYDTGQPLRFDELNGGMQELCDALHRTYQEAMEARQTQRTELHLYECVHTAFLTRDLEIYTASPRATDSDIIGQVRYRYQHSYNHHRMFCMGSV